MQQEPFLVDLTRHDARMAGDEPLLLATAAPTIVGVDRAAAARLAMQLGATALILDDGLHSRRLAPDLAIGVLDSDYGLGNGLCLPAGPLRAPARDFFRLVDAIVVIGEGDVASTELERSAKPKFAARLLAEEADSARLRGVRAFVFSGIARPDKFEKSLRELGIEIAGRRWFPDHHFFKAAELSDMARAASRLGAKLITTQKDAMRLSAGVAAELGIETLAVRLVFDDQSTIDAFVEKAIQSARTIRGA